MAGELLQVGRKLREAREARGLTLAMAEDATKIRKKYLQALEEGRESDLPGEVYTKGYLRTYGNFLGLDGDALVREYKALKSRSQQTGTEGTGTPGAAGAPPASGIEAAEGSGPLPTGEAVSPTEEAALPRRGQPRPAPRRQRGVPVARRAPGAGRRWALAVLVVVLGLAVGWYALSAGRKAPPGRAPGTQPEPQANPQPPAAQQPPVSPEPSAPPSTPPATTAPAPSEPQAPAATPAQVERGQPVKRNGYWYVPVTVTPGPIEVTVTVKDKNRAWYQVVADGRMVASETFPGGSAERYTATEEMTLTLGNLEAVSVTVNGQDLGPLKEPYRRIRIEARQTSGE